MEASGGGVMCASPGHASSGRTVRHRLTHTAKQQRPTRRTSAGRLGNGYVQVRMIMQSRWCRSWLAALCDSLVRCGSGLFDELLLVGAVGVHHPNPLVEVGDSGAVG